MSCRACPAIRNDPWCLMESPLLSVEVLREQAGERAGEKRSHQQSQPVVSLSVPALGAVTALGHLPGGAKCPCAYTLFTLGPAQCPG